MFKHDIQKYTIIYKLLKNILIGLLVIWVLALLGEAILPGFISSHLSFLKLTLLLFAIICTLQFISPRLEHPRPILKEKSRLILFSSIFFVIIIFGLALLKFNYFSNITIILTTLIILFYFYKELLDYKD